MATKTLAEMAELVLEHLGVKAANQTATAADTAAATTAITSTHERLVYKSKAPFDIDEIPEWAWIPLRNVAAKDLTSVFGIAGERLMAIKADAAEGYRELCEQTQGRHNPAVRTRPHWF